MPHAVLLPNMVEFPSTSMKRYARELGDGLRSVAGDSWNIDEMIVHHVARIQRLLPGTFGEQTASRLGRFVRYPHRASQMAGDVFHVLDHSHANLTLSLPGAKSVITCHDIIPLLAAKGEIAVPAKRLTKYTFPLRIRCMKRCRYIIAISESTKRDLIRHAHIPEEKVAVVYYGVNTFFTPHPPHGDRESERRALLAKHNIPEDAHVLLHVGTATRYKNTPALFHLLKILRETPLGKSLYLLRVGAEFFPDEATLLQTLGIGDRVVHAGRVNDDALLASYYRAADLFVFPSIWEGFGWPPLEAMACGTPAVTSNVASLPEVVGDAGLTVAPEDHVALADAVRRVLTEPGLAQQMREKARLRAKRFTWERCAQDTLAVYERIVAENGR